MSVGRRPTGSDLSPAALKADDDPAPVDDHRYLAGAFGMLEHRIELCRVRQDIHIGHDAAFLGVGFTSRPGMRSGVFAENHDFLGHDTYLPIRWSEFRTPAAFPIAPKKLDFI